MISDNAKVAPTLSPSDSKGAGGGRPSKDCRPASFSFYLAGGQIESRPVSPGATGRLSKIIAWEKQGHPPRGAILTGGAEPPIAE